MIYIGYLKLTANVVIEHHLGTLARTGSETLLPEDCHVLLNRFQMVPTNQAIEGILETDWSLPYSHKTRYQIRRMTALNKHITTIFKQDPSNNRLVIVKTTNLKTGDSVGSYLGYQGSPDAFFTLLEGTGLQLSDFTSTLRHELD